LAVVPRSVLVVSDVHLGHTTGRAAGVALATLLRTHPEHELVLAGDTLNLSLAPLDRTPERSVREILETHSELREALRERLERGVEVVFLAGNHDAALVSDDVRASLAEALGVPGDAPISVAAWFLRRGDVHIEHGHLYDPDNAPTHPLAEWTDQTEPVGIALARHFVVRAGAHDFAHSHETTPLAGLTRVFRVYGPRAPAMVLAYFRAAAGICMRATKSERFRAEQHRGALRAEEFAKQVGLDPDHVRELAIVRPSPTHHSAGKAFLRLYLDRVATTILLAISIGPLLAGSGTLGGVAAVSAGYLGFSIARGVNRYGGLLEERMREAARFIRERTGATSVVFGHSHVKEDTPGYLNPGSFGYPKGPRAWVHVDERGHAELRSEDPE
jgi:UDP-2,3-diacylglucosamine pyrophosphatase LpxH